jgi:ureidoglycolate hydrolase
MWKLHKVKVEPLAPKAFAPFGHVIHSFEERQPEVAKGGLRTNAYTVKAGLGDQRADAPGWYEAHKDRVPISEGLQRAHFAFHTDAGQSFFPSRGCPTVYLVGPVKDTLEAKDLRAFHTDGRLGVCLYLKVWHTMPICLEGIEVYQTMRGDQDYYAHSVEIDFDLQQGLSIEPDMENFNPAEG